MRDVAEPTSPKAPAIAQAIDDCKQWNATLKATKNRLLKFRSHTPADDERRRVRTAVRKHREKRKLAEPTKEVAEPTKNRSVAKPARRKHADTHRDAESLPRNVPVNCCGRRKMYCRCFTHGRGLEISRSFKCERFQPIPAQVRSSPIQTWRDTADMPAYKRQIGWNASMRYSWLFPIAFMWRHFSNEHFWDALQRIGAVVQNQQPDFILVEEVMRSFQAKNVSYHGGLFFKRLRVEEISLGKC